MVYIDGSCWRPPTFASTKLLTTDTQLRPTTTIAIHNRLVCVILQETIPDSCSRVCGGMSASYPRGGYRWIACAIHRGRQWPSIDISHSSSLLWPAMAIDISHSSILCSTMSTDRHCSSSSSSSSSINSRGSSSIIVVAVVLIVLGVVLGVVVVEQY